MWTNVIRSLLWNRRGLAPHQTTAKRRLVFWAGWAALFAFSYPLFLYRLSERDLWSSHEARAGQDAQNILDEGRWTAPRLFDGKLELQKPPLYYWLVALTAWLRHGRVDAWDVRIPAATSALALILVCYCWGVMHGRPLAGWITAVVLASAVHFTWLARVGRIDMPLALTTTLAMGAFGLWNEGVAGGDKIPWRYFVAAYVSMAAGFMLKGPIALILTGAAVGLHFCLDKDRAAPWQSGQLKQLARRMRLGWGLALMGALILPWLVVAGFKSQGKIFGTFLWYHNIERAFGGADLRAHPCWFYLPRFFADFLPWSPLLILVCWYAARNRQARVDEPARFGLHWLVGMMLALSCARFKRADYLLPAYPGAALFLGCTMERWLLRQPRRLLFLSALGALLMLYAGGWCLYIDQALPRNEVTQEQKGFASEIRRHAPVPQLILFFRVEAHALAFHVGSPIDTFLEWENLDVWAGLPGHHYIVMPAECAAEWPKHLSRGALEEVARNSTKPRGAEQPRTLVLMRTRPGKRTPA
jgi:4-amino-4-deoxy-L-arabinose transferase-like glycosyltransferase